MRFSERATPCSSRSLTASGLLDLGSRAVRRVQLPGPVRTVAEVPPSASGRRSTAARPAAVPRASASTGAPTACSRASGCRQAPTSCRGQPVDLSWASDHACSAWRCAVSRSAAAAALLSPPPCVAAAGLDWPVEQPVLLGTFGASDSGAFASGIELAGAGQAVWPVADGEVVFRYREGDYSSFARGSGNMVAAAARGRHHVGLLAPRGRAALRRPRRCACAPARASSPAAELEEIAVAPAGDGGARALELRAARRPVPPAAGHAARGPCPLWAAAAHAAGSRRSAPSATAGPSKGRVSRSCCWTPGRSGSSTPSSRTSLPCSPPLPAGRAAPVIEQVLFERDGIDRTPLSDGMVVSPVPPRSSSWLTTR